MSEVYYFQRYYGRENAHSSNALLLLKRIYFYSAKIFYKLIADWTDSNEDDFLPQFCAQDKGKSSVPDFSISQSGFRLAVEAKEKNCPIILEQMKRHLQELAQSTVAGKKILMALKPNFTKADDEILNSLKDNKVTIIKKTYLEIYEDILGCIDEHRDIEIKDLIEEYKEYCNAEELIDGTDNTIMVRSTGDTLDSNVLLNIYFDDANHRYEGFRYLALYNDKKIAYIGKIRKVVKGWEENGVIYKECLLPLNGKVEQEEEIRVVKAMENQRRLYNNLNIPHAYFLVEKFVKVENFLKSKKGPLFGRKKFYLDQFGLPCGCSAEEIAEAMKNKTWEEIERY